jgi:hypothetical protein
MMITLGLYVLELFTPGDSPTRGETRRLIRESTRQIQQELGVNLVVRWHKRVRVPRDRAIGPWRYLNISRELPEDRVGPFLEIQPPVFLSRKGPPLVFGQGYICSPAYGSAVAAVARRSETRGNMLPLARATITHELGHILGAMHTTDNTGMMAAAILPNMVEAGKAIPPFTEESREQVRRCLRSELFEWTR